MLRRCALLMLLAAAGVAGGGSAWAHEAGTLARAAAPAAPLHLHFEADVSLAAGALALAGLLGLWRARRQNSGRKPPGQSRARSRLVPGWLAGALLTLLLWILPWLSLHDTHHLLENGDDSCSVAQIVHTQGGGILASVPALTLPLPPPAIGDVEPLALPSRPAPRPAARSPPV